MSSSGKSIDLHPQFGRYRQVRVRGLRAREFGLHGEQKLSMRGISSNYRQYFQREILERNRRKR